MNSGLARLARVIGISNSDIFATLRSEIQADNTAEFRISPGALHAGDAQAHKGADMTGVQKADREIEPSAQEECWYSAMSRQSAPFNLGPHLPCRLVADAALQAVSDRFLQGVESRTLLLTVRYGDALLDQGHGNLRVEIKRRARMRQTSKGRYLVQCPRSFRQHYSASGYVRPPAESQRIG